MAVCLTHPAQEQTELLAFYRWERGRVYLDVGVFRAYSDGAVGADCGFAGKPAR